MMDRKDVFRIVDTLFHRYASSYRFEAKEDALALIDDAEAKQLALLAVGKQRELLPKRLSNEAYKKAKTMRYEDFVNWWDKQV